MAPVLVEEDGVTQGNMMLDIGCDMLEMATTFTKEEIFNLSSAEIVAVGFRLSEEINKKK